MKNSKSDSRTTEVTAVSEAVAWENSPYYDDAEKWTWLFWSEDHPFFPLFCQLDMRNLLELACGHGRHSEYVLRKFGDRVKSLVMMDILQSNIDWCLQRIGSQDKVKFICNSGTGFQPVAEASITAIFCYDAMVHFHRDVVESYLNDVQRVLVPEGKALFHHSNYAKDANMSFAQNPHARAFMSASLFRAYAVEAGLEVVSQRILAWGNHADLDCLTLVRKL
jgi:cyclopropane fatty-acyl-phospholipid synthase-like methyltransferase